MLKILFSFFLIRQQFVRDVNSFNADQSLVNFTERRFFYFDEVKTKLSLDDNITIVNVPFAVCLSISILVRKINFFSSGS